MGVEPQNPLQFPHRGDFRQDDDAHQRNLDHLERWANGPKDWVLLVNHEELPPVDEFQEGTIVQHKGDIYRKRGGKFEPLLKDSRNTIMLSWSFSGEINSVGAYLDEHPLNIPFDGIITKLYAECDALGSSEILEVALIDWVDNSPGEIRAQVVLDGDEGVSGKERVRFSVKEDEEFIVRMDSNFTRETYVTFHITIVEKND